MRLTRDAVQQVNPKYRLTSTYPEAADTKNGRTETRGWMLPSIFTELIWFVVATLRKNGCVCDLNYAASKTGR